jgi:dolichyl-phosphate beta-glucosyltransferase
MTDSLRNVFLSVVIPAYNEENRIGSTLRRILDYLNLQFYEAEVLVVIDGSQDRTIDVVREFAEKSSNIAILNNGCNRGKGYAVRRGMLESRGQFLLFSDADLSTPINEVERLLVPLRCGYDVAIASRALSGADIRVRQPWWRQLMGRIYNRFVQALILPGIRDSQCGFKCFSRNIAHQVFSRQRIDRFGFDVEVLWIARKLGYRIAEVPVTWVNDALSKVHPVRDSFWMLVDLFRTWHNIRGGSYDEIPPKTSIEPMLLSPDSESCLPVDNKE